MSDKCNNFVCKNCECEKFGQKLAFHTAPTLLGIKCGSLISLTTAEFTLDEQSELFNSKAAAKGLVTKILCSCGNRTLLFVYNEKLMKRRLADPQVQEVLKQYGYPENVGIDECLAHLSSRIRSSEEFPHEIGVFLGYPLEDVVGFIENKGENFKFCGCWKVYGSEENAKRTFANYEKCRKFLCGRLNEGADIYQALKIS
ncbi:MAG: DUF3793 family protein [Oscillospiraceae bacterium]|nr:DUF3793 family protein [Oscillospiraceae bacterium]